MFGRAVRVEELAAIGKRIGRYVDDAHDQRPLAKGQTSLAEIPFKLWAHASLAFSYRALSHAHGSSWPGAGGRLLRAINQFFQSDRIVALYVVVGE